MNTTELQSGPVERIVRRHFETCVMHVNDGAFGVRKCANKPAPGDVLCKRHRATAARSGYEPARVVGSVPPNTNSHTK